MAIDEPETTVTLSLVPAARPSPMVRMFEEVAGL
jgi:hypothetical protein